jgi:hypothetical protein
VQAPSVGVEELDSRVMALVGAARAASTTAAYGRWWEEFCAFCGREGVLLRPAAVESVLRFLASLKVQGRGGSARVAASAVAFKHVREGLPNPCADK